MTQFGVTIPNNWGVDDPQEVLALGPEAEQMGYDSLWVMDHLFNAGYIRERLEDRPYYHPMAMLSYMAATTSRVTLATSVLVLPYHNPVELAKYAATLDQMSGGRVTLGVGAGAMTEEFEALGIPMRERGSLTNESIAIMKELWTNHSPEYHSRRWDFSDLRFSPKPVQQPHIPLWIGGSSCGAPPASATLAPHRVVVARGFCHRQTGSNRDGCGGRPRPGLHHHVGPDRGRGARRPLQPARGQPGPALRRRPRGPAGRNRSLPRGRGGAHGSRPQLRRRASPTPSDGDNRRRGAARLPVK